MKLFSEFIETADKVELLQYQIEELENMSKSFKNRFNEIKDQEVQNEYFKSEAIKYHTKYVFTLNYANKLRKRLNSIKF